MADSHVGGHSVVLVLPICGQPANGQVEQHARYHANENDLLPELGQSDFFVAFDTHGVFMSELGMHFGGFGAQIVAEADVNAIW